MAIAHNNEEKPIIIYTFKKLCNGEQWLAAQQNKLCFSNFFNFCYRIHKNMFFGAFNFEVNVFYIYGKKYTQV